MTPYTGTITANGIYTLLMVANAYHHMYASGNFGGRTATFGYIDGSGAFAPHRDSNGNPFTATTSDGFRVPAPPGGLLALEVTGAGDAPAIVIEVSRETK